MSYFDGFGDEHQGREGQAIVDYLGAQDAKEHDQIKASSHFYKKIADEIHGYNIKSILDIKKRLAKAEFIEKIIGCRHTPVCVKKFLSKKRFIYVSMMSSWDKSRFKKLPPYAEMVVAFQFSDLVLNSKASDFNSYEAWLNGFLPIKQKNVNFGVYWSGDLAEIISMQIKSGDMSRDVLNVMPDSVRAAVLENDLGL